MALPLHYLIVMATPKHIREADREEFIDRFNAAESHDEQAEIRSDLKRLEGGRFYSMLEEMYDMFTYGMNKADREAFAEANQNLIRWMGVYAKVEEINTWEEYTGVEGL